MWAHGLWGGRERLHGMHHGLCGHYRCPSLRERDRERHLHDSVGDGHNWPSWVHDGGHGRRDVHVHAVL